MMSRVATIILLLSLSAIAQSAWPQAAPVSTCEGYIAALQTSVRTGDPFAVAAYADLAEKMYKAADTGAVRHGMKPLPLPADDDSAARRGMVVVNICQSDMSLTYAAAVTLAYVRLRQTAGLSVEW